jgi:hypothetical protein
MYFSNFERSGAPRGSGRQEDWGLVKVGAATSRLL